MLKKQLSLLLVIIVLLVPAIHKVLDAIPPTWFVDKFSDSLLASIPSGITVSYYLIIGLEFVGPVLLLIALVQLSLRKKHQRILSLGFIVCYVLFLILTFGSFLVQDYDNAFRDFIYFIGILVIEHVYFSAKDTKEADN